ncbi:3-oxoacyl-[acyl-carrier-protein] reductase [Adlercreutzia sp. ZJ154]|uniref:3-oxoacyl-[acyl-carrier-protein] reductase n=1 Tax=Adlercreutzia sp. ZJ154 TaxID=2709790 RepID=UPI0013EBD8D2|nr:3-oxoacyl-[acyl-carrier-protein] reductase [Adlercreutzia sp. ZJ154]
MNNKEQRVALITGANRGIGAAIALKLAQAGMNVAINYRSESSKTSAEELRDQIEEECGVSAMCVHADVSGFESAKDMVAKVVEHFGALHVLVNNAGITADGLIMRMSEDQFETVVDTNLGGAFNCMRHAVPVMCKQRWGRIINISSVVGVRGNAGQANYAASKAGIIGLTLATAKEIGARGVTVNAVAPGFIETSMTAALSEKAANALTERIALKRLGQTNDVAAAVAFLASEDAGYITGQVLGVDGGISL